MRCLLLRICMRACLSHNPHFEDEIWNTHQLTGDGFSNWGKNWFPQCVCSSAWTAHTHTHTHKTQTGLWLATRDASASSIRLKIEWFSGAANRQNVKWIWLSWSRQEHGHRPNKGRSLLRGVEYTHVHVFRCRWKDSGEKQWGTGFVRGVRSNDAWVHQHRQDSVGCGFKSLPLSWRMFLEVRLPPLKPPVTSRGVMMWEWDCMASAARLLWSAGHPVEEKNRF